MHFSVLLCLYNRTRKVDESLPYTRVGSYGTPKSLVLASLTSPPTREARPEAKSKRECECECEKAVPVLDQHDDFVTAAHQGNDDSSSSVCGVVWSSGANVR